MELSKVFAYLTAGAQLIIFILLSQIKTYIVYRFAVVHVL